MKKLNLKSIIVLAILILAGGLLLQGCAELSYYGQAVGGQFAVLSARQPVDEILARENTEDELAARLSLTLKMRDFASTRLALPDNSSYRTYADLGRQYAVWNVFAAPELSLSPHQWCYPVLGCVSYRGYFAEQQALKTGEALRGRGLDVQVAGIPTYSTLGLFADPLLNTFAHWPEGRLAELMFHELAHQKIYVKNDSTFNESFATAVGRAGAAIWLREFAIESARAEHEQSLLYRKQFLELTLGARESLSGLYESTVSDEQKRSEKRAVITQLRTNYEALKSSWNGYEGYDRWFAQDLNNAKLGAIATYNDYTDAFTFMLNENGGDFAAFYQAVQQIADLSRKERNKRLSQMTPRLTSSAQ